MWFKLLIFAIAGVALYRFFGGKVPFLDSDSLKKNEKIKENESDFGQIKATYSCAVCGTYVTEEDALIYKRKTYCSTECLEKEK